MSEAKRKALAKAGDNSVTWSLRTSLRAFSVSLALVAVTCASAASLVRVGPRLWVEPPVLELEHLVDTPRQVLYGTKLRATDLFILPGGRLLVGDERNIMLLQPSLDKIGRVDAVAQAAGVDSQDGAYDFIIPDTSAEQVAVGLKDVKHRRYVIATVDLKTFQTSRRVVLDQPEQLPGGGLAERARSDKSRRNEITAFLLRMKHFHPVFFDGRTLVYADMPEYGMSHGRAWRLDLTAGRPELLADRSARLEAYSADGLLVYRPEDAERSIVVSGRGEPQTVSTTALDYRVALLDGRRLLLAEEAADGGMCLVQVDCASGTRSIITTLPLEPWGAVLLPAPAGGRIFVTGRLDGHAGLYAWRPDTPDLCRLTPEENADTIPACVACGGGEFFAYLTKQALRIGYLEDYTAPLVSLSLSPLYRGQAYLPKVDLQVSIRDCCFTSGWDGQTPTVTVNGKPAAPGTIALAEGDNTIIAQAQDRAGNVAHVERTVQRVVPVPVTLADIAAHPEQYAARLVALDGFVLGWAAGVLSEQDRAFLENKTIFPNNYMGTRSEGNFVDQTGSAFFPASPWAHGWRHVIATVRVQGRQWRLQPIHESTLKSKPASVGDRPATR